ncbi:MAG TPA: glycosyltransferase family 39 protein, partial [Candidatus Bathyarchaeia archaeon]|nr:glycosyltransferase family 39 protein [Candidatus Bathyarchaeia archaeon]
MMNDGFNTSRSTVRAFMLACLFVAAVGCLFRVWHITRNEFVFYDEGFYLSHNRLLGETIQQHYPLGTADLKEAAKIYFKTCLASGKSLWFMLSDVRVFFNRVHDWFWPRVIASVCGILTIFLTYCFAVRLFQSRWVAWLSVALLAVLPSHVFYSRTGLQEAFSTLLVLIGFYFYLFPRRFSWKVFLAGLFFGAGFFSNYRLMMLPALIAVAEAWISFAEGKTFDFRKYIWTVLTFFSAV